MLWWRVVQSVLSTDKQFFSRVMDGPGTPSDVIGNSGSANKYPDKLDSDSGSPQPSLAVASCPSSKHRHPHSSSQTDTTRSVLSSGHWLVSPQLLFIVRLEPSSVRAASEGCGETLFSPPGKTASSQISPANTRQSSQANKTWIQTRNLLVSSGWTKSRTLFGKFSNTGRQKTLSLTPKCLKIRKTQKQLYYICRRSA